MANEVAELSKITVDAILLCDDVRVENNGKEILIGVYSSMLTVPQIPYRMGITTWIRLLAPANQIRASIRIRLLNTSQAPIADGMVGFEKARSEYEEYTSIALQAAFEIQAEGWITIRVMVGEEELAMRQLRVARQQPAA